MPSFDTPSPITLSVELGAGTLRVAADAGSTTDIELIPGSAGDEDALAMIEEIRLEHRGERIYVHVPEGRRSGLFRRTPEVVIEARIPAGSNLTARTKSADVIAIGELGETRIETGSGDVQLADLEGAVVVESGSGDIRIGSIAGAASVKSASGDVMITTCCSTAKVHTASGDIMIDTAEGNLDARSASGDVVVREADAQVNTRTASGDVRLERMRGDDVSVVSASGDIEVGIAPDIAVWLDVSSLSGTVSSSLDPTDAAVEGRPTLQLRAHSSSGDITIRSI